MTNPTDTIEPPVAIMMQLANGPTGERYCWEAHALLTELGVQGVLDPESDEFQADKDEYLSELIDSYDSALFDAGFYVWWDAGDVVVWDLRGLSEEERERFYEQNENL